MVLKEIDVLKEHSRTQQKAEVVEPGDKISDLKTTAFDFVPGTVNTKRGGAVNVHEETILWSKNEDAPPIPPRKHVHFTSTPRHPVQSNLFDSDDDNPITGHSGNPFIGNPNNPFTQQQSTWSCPITDHSRHRCDNHHRQHYVRCRFRIQKNEGAQAS